MENTAVKKDRRRKVSSLTVANYALLTLIAVICIVPFFNVISKSFSTYGKAILILPKGWTFYNYKQVFSTFAFFRAFFVSVGVTITGTILSVAVMFMAAYPLSKKDLPFRGAIMVFFTIVMLFSGGIIPNSRFHSVADFRSVHCQRRAVYGGFVLEQLFSGTDLSDQRGKVLSARPVYSQPHQHRAGYSRRSEIVSAERIYRFRDDYFKYFADCVRLSVRTEIFRARTHRRKRERLKYEIMC